MTRSADHTSRVAIAELPGRHGFAYQPALDGLRGSAVVAVILYHLDYPWMGGGFLGVDSFFVLSGYLITSLLLGEFDSTGSVSGVRMNHGATALTRMPSPPHSHARYLVMCSIAALVM